MRHPLIWLFVALILLWVTTLGVLYYHVVAGGFPFLSCCRLPPVTASRSDSLPGRDRVKVGRPVPELDVAALAGAGSTRATMNSGSQP